MKSLRVEHGQGALVTYTNKKQENIGIPMIRLGNGKWRGTGCYLKFGTSKSDPSFAAVFPLPHDWEPTGRILRELNTK